MGSVVALAALLLVGCSGGLSVPGEDDGGDGIDDGGGADDGGGDLGGDGETPVEPDGFEPAPAPLALPEEVIAAAADAIRAVTASTSFTHSVLVENGTTAQVIADVDGDTLLSQGAPRPRLRRRRADRRRQRHPARRLGAPAQRPRSRARARRRLCARRGGRRAGLPRPRRAQRPGAEVAERTALQIQKILARHGRTLDGTGEGDAAEPAGEQLALSALCAAAAGGTMLAGDRADQPLLRVVDPARARRTERNAESRGVNVHAEGTSSWSTS